MAKKKDLTVFITSRSSICDECFEELGRRAWITLTEDKKALCLSCADLDYLVFLPSGDTALTRRSRKHSGLLAVVLKWSKARKRYERQGLLVEEAALDRAEEECLADEEARRNQRERAALRRAELDKEYVQTFAQRIRELFPGCSQETATVIAEHACLKYSGRVGRSAAAKALDEEAVHLAVVAYIRHRETSYDELLLSGWDRLIARKRVDPAVQSILDQWSES